MDDTLFEKGLATRKEVLGKDYVEESLASADEFTAPLQQYITKYCWGDIWNRDGLDRRTRSIINLAMLSALNRADEFSLHVRGALKNGVTKEQIQEVLMQVAMYAGVPAALESFRLAAKIINEEQP